jgi:glutamine amidotransferase
VFYFVHSFYIPEFPATIATTTYGVQFTSALGMGNVFGVQFHPEKSQAAGMALLRNFLQSPEVREKVD